MAHWRQARSTYGPRRHPFAIDRFADQIEWDRLPGHVGLGIDASLEQRDLEGHLRRRADAVSRNRLALDARDVLDARSLRRQQTLAAAMRTDEQLHVEALLKRLEPIADEPGASVRLACRQGLDQRLAACALIEEFDVEIVLGVDALRDAEAERRVAGGHLSPGEPDLWRRRRDRRRKDLAA
jgi:hypothetical protein